MCPVSFTNEAGEALLVKTPRRGWELPGGQVEQGEGLIDALVREAREESGCAVVAGRLVGVYSRLSPPEMVVFLFRGRHVEGAPCASAETVDAGWFPFAQAISLVTRAPNALRLRDALESRERPIYRSYTAEPFTVADSFDL